RRHTRSDRDWSSDVCSSDLTTASRMAYEQGGGDMKEIAPLLDEAGKSATSDPLKSFRAYMKAGVLMSGTKWSPDAELTTALNFRSEERRVGKECRYWWVGSY